MKRMRITSVTPSTLQLREDSGGESRVLEGYALKFGVRSVLLPGWDGSFYEVLDSGCVSAEMLREQRIYFTMFHDRQTILGRWDKGEGSLRLSLDDVGLKVECEMPHTPDGDKALELVRRGDLTEMSFAYWTDFDPKNGCVSKELTDELTDDGEAIYIRHVKRIQEMYDVTVAATPAFPDTEIEARERLIREAVEDADGKGRQTTAAYMKADDSAEDTCREAEGVGGNADEPADDAKADEGADAPDPANGLAEAEAPQTEKACRETDGADEGAEPADADNANVEPAADTNEADREADELAEKTERESLLRMRIERMRALRTSLDFDC